MPISMKNQAAVAGIGATAITRNSGVSELALACEAISKCLDDAGVAPGDVDGLVTYTLETNDEVEVARALATEADFLVCDEPTTLLDLRNTRRVMSILLGLPQQVVLVTHDLDVLEPFDRVLVVDRGRVVADDSPADAVDAYRALVA